MGSAIGTAAVQGGAYLWQQVTQGGSEVDLLRAEVRQLRHELQAAQALPPPQGVLALLPEALRTATSPQGMLRLGANQAVPVVRVVYQGQVLYHNASQQLLVWEPRPGAFQRITTAQQLTQLARQPARQAKPAAPAPKVGLPPTGRAHELLPPVAARVLPAPVWDTAADQAFDAAVLAIFAQPESGASEQTSA
ncbi:hypothetical protein [Hymenobacter elongatus]|uniref:Uncharacterized protein n=1 Tax=Hymenobacter elongatus TaxID=877208 RepID=A0A4Z0PI69_9BACT|nr:hypothetical protein [Hymenobacter elongatus]TGE13810.1 hypothetical protein E5J99_18830 [Hymenobacter elongatus]